MTIAKKGWTTFSPTLAMYICVSAPFHSQCQSYSTLLVLLVSPHSLVPSEQTVLYGFKSERTYINC